MLQVVVCALFRIMLSRKGAQIGVRSEKERSNEHNHFDAFLDAVREINGSRNHVQHQNRKLIHLVFLCCCFTFLASKNRSNLHTLLLPSEQTVILKGVGARLDFRYPYPFVCKTSCHPLKHKGKERFHAQFLGVRTKCNDL